MAISKSRLWLIIATVALSGTIGCRTPPGQQELETELRHDEDKNYQLVAWIQQYHDLLESCRRENTALREKLASEGKPPAAPSSRLLPSPTMPGPAPAPLELPKTEIPKVEYPPGVDAPGGSESESPSPGPVLPSPGDRRRGDPRSRPPLPLPGQPGETAIPQALPEGQEVAWIVPQPAEEPQLSAHEPTHATETALARITLNHMLTTGYSGRPGQGDKGVRLVVEPRNAADELVPASGKLSVMVLDPAGTIEAESHVARWDFSAKETARHYRRTPLADGIQLDLPWQGRAPAHSRLRLYARLTTPDGRQYLTDREINVVLPRGAAAPTPLASLAPPAPANPATAIVTPPGPSVPPATGPANHTVAAAPAPIAPTAPPVWFVGPRAPAPQTGLSGAPRRASTRATALPDPDEAVAIPADPGSKAEANKPPAPESRTAERQPQWSPYR